MRPERPQLRPLAFALALVVGLLAGAPPAAAQEEPPAAEEAQRAVKEGDWVALEFFVILEDGDVFATNIRSNPLEIKQGAGRWVPGVERELTGMVVGETKRVVVGPEDAYGPVDPLAFETVPLSQIPEEAREAGRALTVTRDDTRRTVRIHEIDGETAVIDWNHPLAGKTLTFDVRIVDIKDEPSALEPAAGAPSP
jgi:FKBP-type peptidyl-prolyl cis-trans isomerase 2